MATGDKIEFERMTGNGMSDFEVASRVRMLMRTDLDYEFVCTAGRDRIMYLSQKVMELKVLTDELLAAVDRDELAAAVDRWASSPEGKKRIEEGFAEVREMSKKLRKEHRIVPVQLGRT